MENDYTILVYYEPGDNDQVEDFSRRPVDGADLI
jgi:hypothetical protein